MISIDSNLKMLGSLALVYTDSHTYISYKNQEIAKDMQTSAIDNEIELFKSGNKIDLLA